MDKRAGQYRRYAESSSHSQFSKLHWFTNWHCRTNDKHITENLEYHVKDRIVLQRMKEYLLRYKRYSEEAFESIDWYAIGKAASSLTVRRQIWVTKYVSGFFANATKMYQRGVWDNNLCPMCMSQPKTSSHLIECNNERS